MAKVMMAKVMEKVMVAIKLVVMVIKLVLVIKANTLPLTQHVTHLGLGDSPCAVVPTHLGGHTDTSLTH